MMQVIIIRQRLHGCHSDVSSVTGLASSLAGGLEAYWGTSHSSENTPRIGTLR